MGGEGDPGRSAAELIVACLRTEGVEFVFGIPGEENIHLTNALDASPIRYVLTRHEQAASFMAEMYGRVTGKAGVVSATLGPGAINLQLGVADATTNSTPLVALSAQVGRHREYKESHQFVDLVRMFAPITQFAATVPLAAAIPEMVRRAFKTAQTERPGAVYLAVPEDVEDAPVPPEAKPMPLNVVRPEAPSAAQVERAATILRSAVRPVLLAGHGAARAGAGPALAKFAEHTGIPVATTFHGKGVLPDDHPCSLGTIGFMRHDYANFGFDEADVVIAVGYELQEFDPVKINPRADKAIIHIHRFPAEVDAHYPIAVGIEGDISASLDELRAAVPPPTEPTPVPQRVRALLADELARGAADDRWPLSPQRIVADTREALGRADIALVDTGAVKMWMARLYPTYEANTCLISNGLSTMGFALPGAIGVHLAAPGRKVLAVTGDGAFLMHSQEIETAVRERIPLTVLVWEDNGYGLIEWKMRLETGKTSNVSFGNPEITAYAASFGAKGYRVERAADLLPTLREALADDGVSIVVVPVDYSENLRLTDRLGQLTDPL
ncbi:acetolactate synthase large subunit [Amycolatopsis acidiphila]|uniref:Acetolactate synthase large subunit n=1 Tax=Amycolatopsis acidiphila TaxID=715473 RepID=A0A558A3A4_9PSEU|nr:acetolactate synthase large subunit [Amycolatopsis acidiphila]TVT18750.1 acetolactate synthase large subunit [Amycolatopsis acidiphila]UIJ56935.1 acetolactate synthase large subunit [Amycolatopsis acidiphila]GHG54241.1 putative acetolactate synthase large subunit IlvB [Amycolatopsis acidiphila]